MYATYIYVVHIVTAKDHAVCQIQKLNKWKKFYINGVTPPQHSIKPRTKYLSRKYWAFLSGYNLCFRKAAKEKCHNFPTSNR